MTRVEYRIAAARFFLRTLVEEKPGPPEFDWLLEAFIAAARSVGWLMVAECEQIEILREWQKRSPPEGQVAILFSALTAARNRITKVEPARTTEGVELEILLPPEKKEEFLRAGAFEKDSKFTVTGPKHGPVTLRSHDGKYECTAKVRAVYQTIDEFPNEDILDIAERYMRHLEVRYGDWLNYYKARMRGAAAPQ